MKLQDEIRLRLATCSPEEVCYMMGYKHTRSAKRVSSVLTDPYLGLFSGGYDMKFSDSEFLSALCRTLGIDIADYQPEIEAIREKYAREQSAFKSYLFVDTGFVRSTEPVIALSVCSGQRYIRLDKALLTRPVYEQVEAARKIARTHYREHEGSLGMWGDIKKYLFVYAEDAQIEISPDGEVLKESAVQPQSSASLSINGRDISAMVSDN